MKRTAKKLTKPKNLEEKVDFIIDFLQTQVPIKDEFNELAARVYNVENEVHKLLTSVDKLAKMLTDYHQEMVI